MLPAMTLFADAAAIRLAFRRLALAEARFADEAEAPARPGAVPVLPVAALALARAAHALLDARIVLAWLMTLVGAPLALIGLLVPLREGLAHAARPLGAPAARHGRPGVAAAAALALQAVAAAGLAAAALLLWGGFAGWAILGLLALLALADGAGTAALGAILAGRAGPRAPGAAAARAALLALTAPLLLGLALIIPLGPRAALVLWAVMLASLLLAIAALLAPIATGRGPAAARPGEAPGGGDGPGQPPSRLLLLRMLTLPAFLSLPFLVALAAALPGRAIEALGGLLLGSALGAVAAPLLWAGLALRAPRRLAILSALLAALVPLAAVAAESAGWLDLPGLLPALAFLAALALAGLRLALPGPRAAGSGDDLVLAPLFLAGGLFGLLAAAAGIEAVLLVQAALLCASIPVALRPADRSPDRPGDR
jgi:hypothetical protein